MKSHAPFDASLLPIILLVSSEAAVLEALEHDLGRRFGTGTRIVAADGPDDGIARVEALADAAEPVALVIAEQCMPGMTGLEFLARAHALHPAAKRILLVERDYTTANPTVSAMTLGQIDYHLVRPWVPEHGLYPPVNEFLAGWARSDPDGFALFRVVAPENSARGHELRDLLTRFNMPFTFCAADSDEGSALLAERGMAGSHLPIAIRNDGRLLVDPTNRQLVEAIGGGTDVGEEIYDVAIVGARPRRSLGGRLCGFGRTRDDRPRAVRLRRTGGLELPHPQRPGLHLGHRRPGPRPARVRAGLAVRRQPGARARGDVAEHLGLAARAGHRRRRGGARSHRRARHGRVVAASRDPADRSADRRRRLLRRRDQRGASDAGPARLRRRRRELRRSGGCASREVRRRGHAARPRRLARDEHVRVPDHRAGRAAERVGAAGRRPGRLRGRGSARGDLHPRPREQRARADRDRGALRDDRSRAAHGLAGRDGGSRRARASS